MKFLMFFLISSAAFSAEILTGKFNLDQSDYQLTYTYDLPYNQAVSYQRVRLVDGMIFPETNEPIPAVCYLDMTFPVSYSVEIKNVKTQEIVYTKSGVEDLLTSASGGIISEGKCEWDVRSLKVKVPGMIRITEKMFTLKGKAYRYFMDTYSVVNVRGTRDDLAVAVDSTPLKGNDGKKDGEVWIDTQPLPNGHYDRIWFPLSLVNNRHHNF